MGDYVYVVWYDNGEMWEDNCQDIEGIFSTQNKAESFLEEKGYQKHVGNRGNVFWKLPATPCRAGKVSACDCTNENCPFYRPEGYDECVDAEILYDNSCDQSCYTIRVRLLDPKPGEQEGDVVL